MNRYHIGGQNSSVWLACWGWYLRQAPGEDRASAFPRVASTVVRGVLIWSGWSVMATLSTSFAVTSFSRLCFYTVVEFHLSVAPSFFHCRYKKCLLPHERVRDISHVAPMLWVWLWYFWMYSRGRVLNRRMQVNISSLRLWILWDATYLI